MSEQDEPIKLTQYSRGAGCGCKIAPNVLQDILSGSETGFDDPDLIIGNGKNDDAAVVNLNNGMALISTTDFFMPIVDDAFAFGRIAAANAISDVYAMGGKPTVAIAILGWPVEKLSSALASRVLDGARHTCKAAGIALAGGHSIDATEPIFGLSVTGMVRTENIKANDTAADGDYIFLTKPIGIGILSTAQKRGLISEAHAALMIEQMTTLNTLGEQLGSIAGVTAMTDVTGFGLLGHMIEMANGANLSARLYYEAIPVVKGAKEYLAQRAIPDATFRNWNSYSTQVEFEKGVPVMEAFNLLPDPQTNGGLLFSVQEDDVADIKTLLRAQGLEAFAEPIGRFESKKLKAILVDISRKD